MLSTSAEARAQLGPSVSGNQACEVSVSGRGVAQAARRPRRDVALRAWSITQRLPLSRLTTPAPGPLELPPLQARVLPASPQVWTEFVAETLLPTRQGNFRVRGYRHTVDGGKTFTEPCIIYCGEIRDREDLPVRVHDACFTSEVLGSLKCDCREQLELALEYIQKNGPGAVIYLQQEGRGIGLANKLAAYALQERGLDTVDANRALGLPDDCREYSAVRNVLDNVGVRSVKLLTNNPRKLAEISGLGVAVSGRIPCIVPAQRHSQGYLDAKQARMDHLLGRPTPEDDSDEVAAAEAPAAAADAGAPRAKPRARPAGGQVQAAFRSIRTQ